MAWTPTQNIFDEQTFGPNLVTYLEANQRDALKWANGGAVGPAPFAKIYKSAAGVLGSEFPHLMILNSASDESSPGALEAEWAVVLEGVVVGSNPDTITANSRIYGAAVKSMLKNIPIQTLTAGSLTRVSGWAESIKAEYGILRGTKTSTSFLQTFQIGVTYILNGSPE